MPSARTATAPPRRQTRRKATPRARRVASRGLRGRVRWDRVGRVSLLVVVGIVAALYVQRGLSYFSVRSQADQQRAIVQQLTRSNATLRAQQRSLNDPTTILSDARVLGMVRPGEHPYELTGLPNH
jgi:cell division protein FtsB